MVDRRYDGEKDGAWLAVLCWTSQEVNSFPTSRIGTSFLRYGLAMTPRTSAQAERGRNRKMGGVSRLGMGSGSQITRRPVPNSILASVACWSFFLVLKIPRSSVRYGKSEWSKLALQ